MGNPDLDFEIRILDFAIEREIRREIRPQGRFQFRNPNPDFMDLLLTVRLENPKKDLQNCYRQERSFFANYACACKTAVHKDSQFQIPFRIFQSNGKKEIQKQISQR